MNCVARDHNKLWGDSS